MSALGHVARLSMGRVSYRFQVGGVGGHSRRKARVRIEVCKDPILLRLCFLRRRPSTIESLFIEGNKRVLVERAW